MAMKRIIGIKFSHYGQLYFFYCEDPFVNSGDRVLAETGQGVGLARVVTLVDHLPEDVPPEEVREIVRKVTDDDLSTAEENDTLTYAAHHFCVARIRERHLDMKLVDVELLFDRSKLVFYFTAPTRIDFRELVKDLVREYHTRIELRQIGVRHETQMLGAIGSCGMVCCCRRFLRKFVPVTIKMAKEQNLFLNPSKISGICGRLLCCLSYEQENYDLFHNSCPRLGKRYQTSQGPMKVLRANMFRNSIAVLNETNEELEFTLDEWQALEPRRPESPRPEARPEGNTKPVKNYDELMIVTADPDTLTLEGFPDFDEETGEDNELPEEGKGGEGKRRRKRKHTSSGND